MLRVDPKLTESAIEEMFLNAFQPMLREDLAIEPQVSLTAAKRIYRVDFLIRCDSRVVVIECDGQQFHDFNADRGRDVDLLQFTEITDVVRLRGGDVYFALDLAISTMTVLMPILVSRVDYPGVSEMCDIGDALRGSNEIKPIWRCRVPARSCVRHASRMRRSRGCMAIGTRSPDEVLLELKPPGWDWRYGGRKTWQMGDAAAVVCDKIQEAGTLQTEPTRPKHERERTKALAPRGDTWA